MNGPPADPPTDGARFRGGWLLTAAVVTTAIVYLCVDRTVALGVEGEWVWNRLPRPHLTSLAPVALAGLCFLGLSVVCRRRIDERPRLSTAALLVSMLAVVPVHWLLFFAPPAPLGPERWLLSLGNPASSGYFSVARSLERPSSSVSTTEFLRDYERWIAMQDSFHVGTHPPGLFLVYKWTLAAMHARPHVAAIVWRWTPTRLTDASMQLGGANRLTPAEFAALACVVVLTWAALWLTAPLVYLLAREVASPVAAYTAAMLWLLAPGPLLFMPLADAGYPFFSALVAVLLVAAQRSSAMAGVPLALLAGVVFVAAINMSLAFVVVILFAGLAGLALERDALVKLRWFGVWAAFVVAVVASAFWLQSAFHFDLPAVLKINLEKHRGFYDHFPRSYGTWVGINLVEFAVTTGVLVVAVAAAAFHRRRERAGLAWAFLATLLLLDLTGKNLSEAARLWLFLTPLAAGAGATALEGRFSTVRGYAILLLLQLIATISVYVSVEPLLPVNVAP
jgi:hypothetical protein